MIKKNDVSGCGWPGTTWAGTGIGVVDTSDVVVEDNYVHDNEQAIGVTDYPEALYGATWAGGVSDIVVNGNVVDNNSWGLAISNDASNILVERNEFTNATYDGIDVYDYTEFYPMYTIPAPTGVEIHCNIIQGSGADGLWVGSSVTDLVAAEDNFWGSAGGPSGDGPGSGDSVIGFADFDPWLEKDKLCKGKKKSKK